MNSKDNRPATAGPGLKKQATQLPGRKNTMPTLKKGEQTKSAANLKPSETARARAGSRTGSESVNQLGKNAAAAGGAEATTEASATIDTNTTQTSKTNQIAETEKPKEPLSGLKAPTTVAPQTSGNVQVFARFRPLNSRELETTGKQICCQFNNKKTVSIQGINQKTGASELIPYSYDYVFDTETVQSQVYDITVKPIVDQVLDGYNGTILAYGQTSSGKTHTMLGEDLDNEQERGVIPRMVKGFFDTIADQPEDIEFSIKVSFLEIYNEKIKDLLDPKKNNLKIHETKQGGIYVKDMTESYVGNEDEVYAILKIGNENRSIGCTNMNKQSSRSHSVFILQVEQKNLTDFSQKTGKIYLVDLAGSERISKTGAEGQTLTEAQNINKSLAALGGVINALTDGKASHVPYRDSKLTRLLQESLGGNSKTSLIITCSPSIFNEEETKSTLKFGQRAKQIKNKAKMNKEFSVQELKFMLQAAEKDIRVKVIRIKYLEDYVAKLESVAVIGDNADLLAAKKRLEAAKAGSNYVQQLEALPDAEPEDSTLAESQINDVTEVENESSDSEVDEEIKNLDNILRLDSTANIEDQKSKDAPLELKPQSQSNMVEPSSLELIKVIQDNEKLDPQILKTENEQDMDDKRIDDEIQLQRSYKETMMKREESFLSSVKPNSEVIQTVDDHLSEQSLHEEELIDQNGDFIIFKMEGSPDAPNPQSKQNSFTTTSQEASSPDPATLFKGMEDGHQKLKDNLEPNFEKLNYINKVNILLKALMIERNKNSECDVKVQVLKREYINKVKMIASMQSESEQLIDQVAQGEIAVDKKTEEINYLWQKHMQDKFKIDQQNEKIKSYDQNLKSSEQTQQVEAKEMEDRIDKRVKKILDQERELMKQQKRIILEKQKNQEHKINSLKQQLKEAKANIQKQKQMGLEERGDSFQNTLNKLINSEKNLDQLKLMYHHLSTNKEQMKKEMAVLEKKYKRSQQKNKNLDNDLKITREQVSEFKQRFRTLSQFIQKKGGIEVLNSLPNVHNDANGDIDTNMSMKSGIGSTQKIGIRGGIKTKTSMALADKQTIRGGTNRMTAGPNGLGM